MGVGNKLSEGYRVWGLNPQAGGTLLRRRMRKQEICFNFALFYLILFGFRSDQGLYCEHDNLKWTACKEMNKSGCYLIYACEFQKRYQGKKYQFERYQNKNDIESPETG